MESLLSVSFDNISSKDITKIRKGLRQIESLLAQICLNNGSAGAHQPQSAVKESNRRQSAMLLDAAPKTLQALSDDLAFREFFRLQESFEWNGKSLQIPLAFLSSTLRDMTRSGDAPNRDARAPPRAP